MDQPELDPPAYLGVPLPTVEQIRAVESLRDRAQLVAECLTAARALVAAYVAERGDVIIAMRTVRPYPTKWATVSRLVGQPPSRCGVLLTERLAQIQRGRQLRTRRPVLRQVA